MHCSPGAGQLWAMADPVSQEVGSLPDDKTLMIIDLDLMY